MPTTLLLGEDMPSIKTEQLTLIKGLSLKDVRTNLGIFGTPPPPLQACPHLVDHPPAPCPCGHTRLALFETLQLVNNSH